MRLAKLSRTLMLLALPAIVCVSADAQDHPNVQPSNIRDQLNQAPATPPSAPAAPAAPAAPKPEPKPNAAPAPAAAKAPATGTQTPAPAKAPAKQAKAPAKAPAKAAAPAKAEAAAASAKAAAPAKTPAPATEKKAEESSAKPPSETPAEEKTTVARRDPFDPLLNKPAQGNATPENLPPGKAGLVVGTLRIDGIVGGAHGMIAIVSNPQQRVYFLREGDKLYDGSVEHITLEAVSFQEVGKDAFGKPMERQVTKRLYPSPGDQQ